jgi:hypothetical protein
MGRLLPIPWNYGLRREVHKRQLKSHLGPANN